MSVTIILPSHVAEKMEAENRQHDAAIEAERHAKIIADLTVKLASRVPPMAEHSEERKKLFYMLHNMTQTRGIPYGNKDEKITLAELAKIMQDVLLPGIEYEVKT